MKHFQLAIYFVSWSFFFGFQGKKDLVAVDNTEYEGDEGEVEDSENEETHESPEHSSGDLEDSDEERKR